MYCPRCGSPLPPNAAFCMRCGQALAQVPSAQSPQPQEGPRAVSQSTIPPAKPRKWVVPTIVGVLVVLGLLLAGIANLLSTGRQAAPPLVSRGSASVPPLQAGKPTMPQDVHDWLDHLRETEDRKNLLAQKQTMDAIALEAKLNISGIGSVADVDKLASPDQMPDPAKDSSQKIADMRPAWREIIKFFESVRPPRECENVAHTYDRALDEVSGQMGDLGDILNNMGSGDPQESLNKLSALQGRSAATIDKYFGVADTEVQQICDKYSTTKWFVIKADVGSPFTTGGVVPPIPNSSK